MMELEFRQNGIAPGCLAEASRAYKGGDNYGVRR
jgi:hypothetical protein